MAKLGSAQRQYGPKAERIFKKRNPEWRIEYPWFQQLSPIPGPEWMLQGKFRAFGPEQRIRDIWVKVWADGIRVY